jgi:hypothetical protein
MFRAAAIRPEEYSSLGTRKPIPREISNDVVASEKSPAQVKKTFRDLLASGHSLHVDGQANSYPEALLRRGYTPKYEVELFGTRFFLCNLRISHELKLMPAYVLPVSQPRRGGPKIYARVFYKDSSLVWRAASHYINTPDEQWIGKGAVKWLDKRGESGWHSAEETTNLPFEMQAALDDVSMRGPRARVDNRVLFLMLRNAPSDRIRPYHDFQAPRARAMKIPANRINSNRPIAWFADEDNPASLQVAPGFQPDFKAVIDTAKSNSKMYGGKIRKHRIASRNRQIQYLFVEGPQHVWVVHPQSLTVELSSFGLRTVDVIADDDISIPGYEFFDSSGDGEIDDQIPRGYAGAPCPFDADRADASPWNDRLPIVRAFRRATLARLAKR